MGAEPIGSDPSGAGLILIAPNPGQGSGGGVPFLRAGPGRRAGSSTAGDTHTQRQEEALAFAERGDGFGPAAGQQFEESLLQRFFSLARRVAWKKEGVTKQKKS